MILAAGLGTRLRPLTYLIPKPLLPVNGAPMIDWGLKLLERAGIREVVINLHHLPDKIRGHVGNGKKFGLKVNCSYEPKILGTGGGIKKVERFFRREPFIVMNSDTIIKIGLRRLIRYHFKKGGVATLVVREARRGEPYSRLDITKDGRLKAFGRGRYMFTGIQILTPEIFNVLPRGRPACLIKDGYRKLLAKGLPIYTYLHTGPWQEIGTLAQYKSGISA